MSLKRSIKIFFHSVILSLFLLSSLYFFNFDQTSFEVESSIADLSEIIDLIDLDNDSNNSSLNSFIFSQKFISIPFYSKLKFEIDIYINTSIKIFQFFTDSSPPV